MKLDEYNLIVIYIENHPSKCSRTILSDMLLVFKDKHKYHTLLSVFLNHLQRKVRATHYLKSRPDKLKHYYELYKQKIGEIQLKNEGDSRVLIDLSIEFELPPCLMARLVVGQFLIEDIAQQNTGNAQPCEELKNKTNLTSKTNSELVVKENNVEHCKTSKSEDGATTTKGASLKAKSMSPGAVTEKSAKNKLPLMIKDPYLIPNETLREQVLQCISYDVCYGPLNDAIRHSVGLEFEEKLKDHVKGQNLPLLDENDLRRRGYDKTPDVKLEVPITVQGHPVCWIESKASFGDLDTHSEYLRSQYHSYWNRFGPGLVIYWFGFIEDISEEMQKQGILIMDHFPSDAEITFMNP